MWLRSCGHDAGRPIHSPLTIPSAIGSAYPSPSTWTQGRGKVHFCELCSQEMSSLWPPGLAQALAPFLQHFHEGIKLSYGTQTYSLINRTAQHWTHISLPHETSEAGGLQKSPGDGTGIKTKRPCMTGKQKVGLSGERRRTNPRAEGMEEGSKGAN